MTARKRRGGGNYIAEWFGHRVYPVVAQSPESLADQASGRCPFLSDLTGRHCDCAKTSVKSKGVCTISSTSNGERQDWLVCPFRALDLDLLDDAARRMFGHPPGTQINLVAASVLQDAKLADGFRKQVRAGTPSLVYFQSKVGGEISISATDRSPEFSFDATMVEIVVGDDGALTLGRYGIFEIQTMDFHGTYGNAVENLKSARHLHKDDFGKTVGSHQEWLSEKVEGPNIANAFKRTFYQMMFKFQIGAHGQSAGCTLAIPEAVWDSWQRHLGKPDLVQRSDGTFRLALPEEVGDDHPPAWIYVFDLDVSANVTPNDVRLKKVIGTNAKALSHFTLDVAPEAALEEGGSVDRLLLTIQTRLAQYLPEFLPPRPTSRQRQLPGV